jgi:hypothetical protein
MTSSEAIRHLTHMIEVHEAAIRRSSFGSVGAVPNENYHPAARHAAETRAYHQMMVEALRVALAALR